MPKRILTLAFLALTTLPAVAALSPQFAEWGSGPAQWIMSSDEKKAWRKVSTDDEAIAFINLFWARRDPTEGTPQNEYRNEYEGRVAFSDERYQEKRKRGSLTDRGRVYIVLGKPSNLTSEMIQNDAQQSVEGDDARGSMRQRGAREVWIWEKADARQFDMARIEILFIEDPATHRTQRDPRKADFGLAEVNAIRKANLHPELTELPEWAAFGGLTPMVRASVSDGPAVVPSKVVEAPPVPAGPAVASATPGASRLTFLRGGSIDARAADPFAVTPATTIAAGKDAPWAVQYCSARAEQPKLEAMLLLNGPSGENATKPKDPKPQRIASMPGCYVLQGMVPVSKLAPGRYKISVLIDDTVTKDSHTLKGEITVE